MVKVTSNSDPFDKPYLTSMESKNSPAPRLIMGGGAINIGTRCTALIGEDFKKFYAKNEYSIFHRFIPIKLGDFVIDINIRSAAKRLGITPQEVFEAAKDQRFKVNEKSDAVELLPKTTDVKIASVSEKVVDKSPVTINKNFVYGGGNAGVQVTTIQGPKHDLDRILKNIKAIRSAEGLAPISDIKEVDGKIEITEPIYDDGNLREALSEGLSEKEKLCIARDIIKGLKSLDSHNIAHLDIKPENILLKRDFQGNVIGALISDFHACTSYEELKKSKSHGPEKDILDSGNVLKELFKDQSTILSRLIEGMCKPKPADRFDIDEITHTLGKIEARNATIDIQASLDKTPVTQISEADLQTISDYILKNRARLQQDAKSSPNNTIYQRIGLPRAVQFDADGRVLIHFNKGKLGDKILGEGSFKRVRVAMDFDNKTLYAVARSTIRNEHERLMTERETIFLEKFRGKPGISQIIEEVKVMGKGYQEKSFSIQPIYNAGELFESIDILTPKEKYKVALDLLEGFATLEQSFVIHRDIKLENILLERKPDGTLKAYIADFGLACMSFEDEEKQYVAGTPEYIDPERIKAFYSRKPVENVTSHKGDMWSFGIALYRLIHDRYPFDTSSVQRINYFLANLKTDLYPLPSPDTKDPLELLIYRCLRRNPAQRISGTEALATFGPLLKALL